MEQWNLSRARDCGTYVNDGDSLYVFLGIVSAVCYMYFFLEVGYLFHK